MNKLLLFDCETGGPDPREHSLLTVFMTKLIETGNPEEPYIFGDSIDLKIRHEPYRVRAEALNINKIDLIEHDSSKDIVSTDEAERIIRDFLVSFKGPNLDIFENGIGWIPIGWRIGFDISFLQEQVFKDRVKNFDRFTIDIKDLVLAEQCKPEHARKISMPKNELVSLGRTAKTLNLNTDNMHNGKKDCQVTLKIFNHLMKEECK